MSPAGDGAQVVEVAGRRLRVSSLDKVLYPATGTTKAEVLDYLVRVSEPLLRQLRDRPVTRIRWPHGVGDASFFEKNVPPGVPDWLRTALVPARASGDGEILRFPLLDDVAGLVWAGNLNALELHTPQWRVLPAARGRSGGPDETAGPDRLVVDLDPGPGTGLPECAELACTVAERLADDGLDSVPVTSGSKGLQLYAPVSGEQDAEVVRAYVRRLAERLAKEAPRRVTANMTKALRHGRVLLDWSQNTASKTTVTPYSLRAREVPTVAAPRWWEELDEHLTQLGPAEVLDRLEADGDVMAAFDVPGPRLPEA